MTRKQRRLALIGAAMAVLAAAVALVLVALRDSIVFFTTPSEIVERGFEPGQRFRLGGLVENGSIKRGGQLVVTFTVTDGKATMPVNYRGILPDLFREGQGVIAEGMIEPGGTAFRADNVLARHDENYMPKEVADALKKQGHWKNDAGNAAPAQGSRK